MTIAITGATGQLGRLVIETLKARTDAGDLVALARTPQKAADLGIAVRPFDYDAPATLAATLAGVDTLLLISGSEIGRRAAQHAAVIDAARAAGVDHIVYTSLLRADASPLSLAGEHVATEAALAASGIAHTTLRNGWYTENCLMGVPAALAHGALIGAAGDGRISAATRADYAEAAATVLLDANLRGRTFELAGDESFSLADLAATVSAATGRAIPFVNLSEADYAAALADAGAPADFAAALASFDTGAAAGALFEDGHALSRLIGRPTTPLRDAVAAALTASAPHAAA
ncbi:MAG: SDR family oxidoreductase [Acuticoccus sp.]